MNDPVPQEPFVGLKAYTIAERSLFMERDAETAQLKDMILAHRVVLLYGDSGNGKSSLINAGLAPALQKSARGFQPERIRIAPDLDALLLDSAPLSTPGLTPFQSIFAGESQTTGGAPPDCRVTPEELGQGLRRVLEPAPEDKKAKPRRTLLMFDQFEELHGFVGGRAAFSVGGAGNRSWDDAAGLRERQERLAASLSALLADDALRQLPAKFLFIFREEYLAKLLALVPELNGASPFRLASMTPDAYARVIGGPFRAQPPPPGPFAGSPPAEFFCRMAAPIGEAFRQRAAGTGQSILTEIQVYGGELWRDATLRREDLGAPDAVAADIPVVLANFFQKIVGQLGPLQTAAIAVLCEMVTADKTRNIVSEATLFNLLAGPGVQDRRSLTTAFARDDVRRVVNRLEENRIINRSDRSGAQFYDLASEALIPWLGQERSKRIAASERAAVARRRWQWISACFGALLVVAGGLALWGLYTRSQLNQRIAQVEMVKAQKIAQDEMASLALVNSRNYALQLQLDGSREQNLLSAKAAQTDRYALELAQVQTAVEVSRRTGSTAELNKITELVSDPLVARLSGHGGAVTVATFSPDGKWVATGGDDQRVHLWTTSGEPLDSTVVYNSPGGVSALAFTPDSRTVFACGGGGPGRWYAWRDRKLHGVGGYQLPGNTVSDAEFSVDGRLAVFGFAEGKVALVRMPATLSTPLSTEVARNQTVDSETGRKPPPDPIPNPAGTPSLDVLVQWTQTRNKDVSEAHFAPYGKRVVTSSDDGTVRVYATDSPYGYIPDGETPRKLGAPARGFRFSPYNSSLVVGGSGNENVVWLTLEKHSQTHTSDHSNSGVAFHAGAVLGLAFQARGEYVATVGTDGRCIVWDVRSEKSIAAVPTEITGRLFDCAWCADRLALVGEDGWLEVWGMEDPAKPRKVFSVRAHQGPAWGVSFNPGGDLLLTWSSFPPESVPDPKAAALTNFKRPGGDPQPDDSAALWDVKRCEQKGWTSH